MREINGIYAADNKYNYRETYENCSAPNANPRLCAGVFNAIKGYNINNLGDTQEMDCYKNPNNQHVKT